MAVQSEAPRPSLRSTRWGERTAALAGLVALWALASGSGCAGVSPGPGPAPGLTELREIAGTPLQIETRDPDLARSRAAVELALTEGERVAHLVLAEIATSEIDILNHVPSHVFFEVSSETVRVLALAIHIAEESGGAYDPTTGPLLDLWGVRDGYPTVPRDFEIDLALRKVDYADIEIGESGHSIRRLSRRTQVDPGPVARGAVVDAVLQALRGAGVPAARVTWGSIAAAFGGKAEAPWLCPVYDADGEAARSVSITTGAVASVSPVNEWNTDGGQRVHELMDGRTGRPAVAARWAAATAPDAASAAGFATAAFILGNEASEMLEGHDDLGLVAELEESGPWESAGFGER